MIRENSLEWAATINLLNSGRSSFFRRRFRLFIAPEEPEEGKAFLLSPVTLLFLLRTHKTGKHEYPHAYADRDIRHVEDRIVPDIPVMHMYEVDHGVAPQPVDGVAQYPRQHQKNGEIPLRPPLGEMVKEIEDKNE